MAEKCRHIGSMNGRNLVTEFNIRFHTHKTKKALFLAYGLLFFFLFFTVFSAINLSSNNYSSLWFTKVLCIDDDATRINATKTLLLLSNDYEHRFSSLFAHFKSNTTTTRIHKNHNNITLHSSDSTKNHTFLPSDKVNDATSSNEPDKVETIEEKGSFVKNQTVYLAKKHSNGGTTERDDSIKSLMKCDFYEGNWVIDETYPLYKPGSCSVIDQQFNCFINGRPDNLYEKLKWKPKSCTLPRLNGSHMLELLTGKRVVFVGDSLNRNMWESLICILKNSVTDKSKVYEATGKVYCKTEVSYSYVFQDYNFTVEFYVSPFLVQEWETKNKNGDMKETLRLDTMGKSAYSYKDADILIFNTGHWWTHEKTSLGKDYYQERRRVHRELNVLEAFRRALTTWGKWLDANVNATKSLVLFRGYSASHFSGGQWNSGGACDNETDPIKNEAYLSEYPDKMTVLESVFKGMKTKVSYMNVTRMTDYRKDGHPSVYRKENLSEEERRLSLSVQDCSHWCLPGVPDLWNEILYAELLLNEHNKHQQSRDTL